MWKELIECKLGAERRAKSEQPRIGLPIRMHHDQVGRIRVNVSPHLA